MKTFDIEVRDGKMVSGRENFAGLEGKYAVVMYSDGTLWDRAGLLCAQYLAKGSEMDVHGLLRLNDELSVLYVTLCKETGLGFGRYVKSYGARKIQQAKKFKALMGSEGKMSATQAEKEVIAEIEDAVRDEADAEEQKEMQTLMLQGFNRVLSAIQQRLSHEKEEWKYNNRG